MTTAFRRRGVQVWTCENGYEIAAIAMLYDYEGQATGHHVRPLVATNEREMLAIVAQFLATGDAPVSPVTEVPDLFREAFEERLDAAGADDEGER